jgi:hypothetical protein
VVCCTILLKEGINGQSNKSSIAGTITGEPKRRQRNAKRQPAHRNPKKKGRELVPLLVGSYLTHGPSNVTCVEKGINHPTTR